MKKITFLLCSFIHFAFAIGQKTISILPASDNIPLSVVTTGIVTNLFTEMNNSSLFNMNDCNNCEDRANAIAYILAKRGYRVAKFWLFGEGKISISREVFLLKFGTCGTWGYHVAVGLECNNNGKTDTLIIDPATQESAVTLNTWALNLLQQDRKGYVAVKDINYYTFPVINNKFQAGQAWTAIDTDLWKTACGLCGLKPRQCDKNRFAMRISVKRNQLLGISR